MPQLFLAATFLAAAAFMLVNNPDIYHPRQGERWRIHGKVEGFDTSLGSQFYRDIIATFIPGAEQFDLAPDGSFVAVIIIGPGAHTINTKEVFTPVGSPVRLRITKAKRLS